MKITWKEMTYRAGERVLDMNGELAFCLAAYDPRWCGYVQDQLVYIIRPEVVPPTNFQELCGPRYKQRLECAPGWDQICNLKIFPERFATVKEAQGAAVRHFAQELERQKPRGEEAGR